MTEIAAITSLEHNTAQINKISNRPKFKVIYYPSEFYFVRKFNFCAK